MIETELISLGLLLKMNESNTNKKQRKVSLFFVFPPDIDPLCNYHKQCREMDHDMLKLVLYRGRMYHKKGSV